MKTIKIRLILLIFFSLWLISWYPVQIPTRITIESKKYLNADLYSADMNREKPVILIQTPYNKDLYHIWEKPGFNVVPVIFDTINYNYVIMDWRGFYSNLLKDSILYDRGLDGFDAVEWIAQQSWCNGKVATWGGSALGEIQFRTAKENPPHLVCAAPFIKDFKTKYSDFYYGGVLRKEHVESLEKLGFTKLALVTANPVMNLLWSSIEKLNDYPDKFNVPMLIATGWFDLFPGDVIRAFEDIQARSTSNVRDKHKLIVGPWTHTTFGEKSQGIWEFPSAEHFEENMAKDFFDYYLLGIENGYSSRPSSYFFEMGTDEWYTYRNWSSYPRDFDTLYLNENGRLLTTPPPPKMSPLSDPPDTIVYNPLDPSPTIGGSRFNPFDSSVKTGPLDVSTIVENRNDVLVYTSELNEESFDINGSIKAELFVSSDRKDTDFSVRLCLVTSDNKSVLLTQGIKRARFREGLDKEIFMQKDSIYKIEIELEPLSLKLKLGEQLRVDITSSNYPMFDINLNDGGELYKAGDTLIATNLIYSRSEIPSRLIVPSKKLFTDVNSTDKSDDIIIFPNPAANHIEIKDPNSGILSFKILNITGEIIQTGSEARSIDVSNLSNGFYVIFCHHGNGSISLKKLIIKR